MRQYKTFLFKAGDTSSLEENQFQGYAAAWALDSIGDVIERGAFARTISEFLSNGTICWQHQWDNPIGKPQAMHEDETGLYIKGLISETTQGKDALILMRDDVIKKMSIGYEAEGYRILSDEEGIALLGQDAYDAAMRDLPWWMDGLRMLTQIKLYEVSLVTIPANMGAAITGVKDLPLTGLTLDDHFTTVHAAMGDLLERFGEVKGMRAKSGRVLSASNRAKLQTMADSLSSHVSTLSDLLDSSAAGAEVDLTDPGHDGDNDMTGQGDTDGDQEGVLLPETPHNEIGNGGNAPTPRDIGDGLSDDGKSQKPGEVKADVEAVDGGGDLLPCDCCPACGSGCDGSCCQTCDMGSMSASDEDTEKAARIAEARKEFMRFQWFEARLNGVRLAEPA